MSEQSAQVVQQGGVSPPQTFDLPPAPPHIVQVPGDEGRVLAQAAATAPTAVQAAAAVQEMVGNQLPILQQAEQEALSAHPSVLFSFTWVVAVLALVGGAGWLVYQSVGLHNVDAKTALIFGVGWIGALFTKSPTLLRK